MVPPSHNKEKIVPLFFHFQNAYALLDNKLDLKNSKNLFLIMTVIVLIDPYHDRHIYYLYAYIHKPFSLHVSVVHLSIGRYIHSNYRIHMMLTPVVWKWLFPRITINMKQCFKCNKFRYIQFVEMSSKCVDHLFVWQRFSSI